MNLQGLAKAQALCLRSKPEEVESPPSAFPYQSLQTWAVSAADPYTAKNPDLDTRTHGLGACMAIKVQIAVPVALACAVKLGPRPNIRTCGPGSTTRSVNSRFHKAVGWC